VDEPFFRELIDLTGHTHAPTQRTVTELAAGSPLLPPQTTPDLSPSVREVRRVPATETTAASPARVFDVGENIAGRSRITIRSSAPLPGRTIRVVHAEHLRDGRADTTNLALPADVGRQRQTTEYRCGDDTISVLEPMFAIHGFRFVDIVGLDDDDDVTVEALVIHSDLASAGHIETDDPVIERLMTVADRTARNTMHGIPEDCPTREQAGWTGDAAAVADFTFASYDLDTFAAAWITDILDSQRADGSIPAVAPDVRADGFDTDPVWGSALVRMVSRHLAWTGRSDVARDALPGLRRWLDFLDGLRDDDGLVSLAPVSYGHDWLGLEQTPPVLLHTASVIEQAETLATLEESVGDAAAAADRRALAAALRSAFRAAYVRRDAEGLRVGPSSQGALAAALAAGALGQEEQSEAVDLIVADIVRRGHRVSTGYAATRWLLDALGEARRHDLVRAVLDQPDEPGVGAMLRSPHGTFWECWWVDRENTGTGSLDHIGLGGVFAAWTWRWLVGLRPASPGARHLRLRPDLPTQTRTVRARRLLPAGPLEVHLRREDDVVAVEVELPRGATVALEHPDGTVEALPPGRHRRVLRQRHTSEDDADAEPATPWAWTGYPDARTSPDERDAHIVALDRHGDPALDVVGPLRCMPVPHAQPATDWCRLPAGAAGAPRVLTLPVRHEFEHETGFAFAWIDICDMAYSRELRASIEVIGERGTRRSAERRLWPAGANRVACALDGWPREEIIEHISVTVQPTPDDAGRSSAPIHVGRVGFSARSRSW
jgi:alpha-L-rhamnosidase